MPVLEGEVDDEIKDLPNKANVGAWAEYFDSKPWSTAALRTIAPHAFSACEEAQGQQWSSPEHFPPPITLWFKGQQHTLFRNAWPKTPSGARQSLCQIAGIEESSSLVAITYAILTLRLEMLNTLQLKNKALNNHEDLWYIGLEKSIQLACCECGKQSREKEPVIWAVNAPDHIVARKRWCRSGTCGVKEKWFIPQDHKLLWITSSIKILKTPNRTFAPDWKLCVRLPENTQGLSRTVRMFCVKCKENTKTMNDESSYLETEPQWTLGHQPLLVEWALFCKVCNDFTRFIPVNEAMPSILRKNLSNIVKRWGTCGQPVLAKVLDTWSPSSRIYRKDLSQLED